MDRAALNTFVQRAVATLLASSAAAAAGQGAATSVFTVDQATAGRAAYAKSCASCHMPDLSGNNEMPPLAGPVFMSTWGRRSTKELFDYTATSMPYGRPSLDMETYESITAFILQSNGALGGSQPFRASTAVAIDSITNSGVKEPDSGGSGKW